MANKYIPSSKHEDQQASIHSRSSQTNTRIFDNSFLPNHLRYDRVSFVNRAVNNTDNVDIDTGYGDHASVSIIWNAVNSISVWDSPYTTKCEAHKTENLCHHENCRWVRLALQHLKRDTHPSLFWVDNEPDSYKKEKRFLIGFLNSDDGPLLDVGCWTHKYHELFPIPKEQIYGLESYPDAVDVANFLRAPSKYKVGSMDLIPFKERQFKTVVCYEVIEHVATETLEHFLQESHRVLYPSGVLWISTPNGTFWPQYSSCPTHKKEYNPGEILELADKYGFIVTGSYGYGILRYRNIVKKILLKLSITEEGVNSNLSKARTILYKLEKK